MNAIEGWVPPTAIKRRRELEWGFPFPLLADGGSICGVNVVFVGGAEAAVISVPACLAITSFSGGTGGTDDIAIEGLREPLRLLLRLLALCLGEGEDQLNAAFPCARSQHCAIRLAARATCSTRARETEVEGVKERRSAIEGISAG